jgi:hypothetical protein
MQVFQQHGKEHSNDLKCSRFATNLNLPIRKQSVLLIDLEVREGLIAIFGYYSMGTSTLNQIIFPEPILPSLLLNMQEIKTLLASHRQYAIYNVSFEAEILNLPIPRCIELMPYYKCQKERFIQIEGLTKISSAHLPDYEPKNIALIAKHNLSCLIKELTLYIFHELFTNPQWSTTYMEMIGHGLE